MVYRVENKQTRATPLEVTLAIWLYASLKFGARIETHGVVARPLQVHYQLPELRGAATVWSTHTSHIARAIARGHCHRHVSLVQSRQKDYHF